jgi:hypothetical protein
MGLKDLAKGTGALNNWRGTRARRACGAIPTQSTLTSSLPLSAESLAATDVCLGHAEGADLPNSANHKGCEAHDYHNGTDPPNRLKNTAMHLKQIWFLLTVRSDASHRMVCAFMDSDKANRDEVAVGNSAPVRCSTSRPVG